MLLAPENYPSLPKYPAVFITGANVTPEQAKEIIFRTDTSIRTPSAYMISGNDRRFQTKCETLFGWGRLERLHKVYEDKMKFVRENPQLELQFDAPEQSPWSLGHEWSDLMGMIRTEYVHNSFLSTSCMHGPSGWCNPTGVILLENQNYGKWPNVADIVSDWTALVNAFPYLDLVHTLYSSEVSEPAVPVCTIIVKNGTVEVHAPNLDLHGRVPNIWTRSHMGNLMAVLNGNCSSEQGWPSGWLEEFGLLSNAALDEVLPCFMDGEISA